MLMFLLHSSVATSVIIEDMVQTNVPTSTGVGTQPTSAGTIGTLCFNESKAKDFEKITNLVLTSNLHLQKYPAGNRCKVS